MRTEAASAEPMKDENVLMRVCRCVGTIGIDVGDDVNAWLTRVCRLLTQTVGGDVASMILLVDVFPGGREWTVRSQAHAGFPQRVASALDAQFEANWPTDDLAIRAGHARWPLQPTVGRPTDLLDEQTWRRSNYRAFRVSNVLRGFARWVDLSARRSRYEVMIVQLEDLANETGPTDAAIQQLRAISPEIMRVYNHHFVRTEEKQAELMGMLSRAQRVVAEMLIEGLSEREIAQRINRSPHTVHDHTKAIYATWGVRSRAQLTQLFGKPAHETEHGGGEAASATRKGETTRTT
jgi:DNA-binding CsgD family transcriptional regulator